MSISDDDRRRISAAIRAAEQRTSAEIVCVLAESSAPGPALPLLVSALVALALPWLLVALTAMTVQRILLLQIMAFCALLVVLSLPAIQAALTPQAIRRALARRQAHEQFVLRGIARTSDRSGVLIFVSLAEHYARIVADEGIAARVPQDEWQDAVDALVAPMRDGRIGDGFIAAIDRCADRLADNFPRTAADRSELPDRIYVI